MPIAFSARTLASSKGGRVVLNEKDGTPLQRGGDGVLTAMFTVERDAFFSMDREDFAEEMLDDAGAKYMIRGNQIYVVGWYWILFALPVVAAGRYGGALARALLAFKDHGRTPVARLLRPAVHRALLRVVDFWFDLGVDGIMTNRPDLLDDVMVELGLR